jgi:rhamnosyltransferase
VLTRSDRFADCIVIGRDENLGIAEAQNVGAARARAEGAEAVVFLDQDSVIGDGFLEGLLASIVPGVPNVVAPVARNASGDFEYAAARVSRLGIQRRVPAAGRLAPYEVDLVMSSGTAATIEALDLAGGMDPGLFIDFVDLEWCLRCRQHGIPIRVVPSVVMTHMVGDRTVDIGIAKISIHSPTRCYYQVRNCCRLFSRDSVPLLLAVREAVSMAVHKALLLLVVRNRREYLGACFEGLRDGLGGVAGKRSLRVEG